MNIRFSSAAFLFFFLSIATLAAAGASLTAEDFSTAKLVQRDGKTLVQANLNHSGLQKFKSLNKTAVDTRVRIDVGGVSSDLLLRVPIDGPSLEMGPYPEVEARKIVAVINN